MEYIGTNLDSSTLELLEKLSLFGTFTSGISDLVSLAIYVLTALGFYTIAQRRGISNPWLAWIPIAQLWVLGSISDQYQHLANHRTTRRRRLLILMNVLIAVLVVILVVLLIGVIIDAVVDGMENIEDPNFWLSILGELGGALLVILAMAVAGVVLAVIQYMALYDVYRSCDPNNATLFLILSIFISFAQPICLMLCRNKDAGMPVAAVPIPEPWETN